MDLLEYQGKLLMAAAGVPKPRGRSARNVREARQAAAAIGYPVMVKAQVLAGGRGKAGGVQVAAGPEEVSDVTERILRLTIGGRPVHSLLIEEVVRIQKEFYLAITLDRREGRPLLLLSPHGGANVEDIARLHPEELCRVHLDPLQDPFAAVHDAVWASVVDIVSDAGLGVSFRDDMLHVIASVYKVYRDSDATLIEINPLAVVNGRGDCAMQELLALDAKVSIDDSAMFRHGELAGWRIDTDDRERRAREAGVTYVTLDGDMGVLGNGAGLVMSTVDQIANAGGSAANFCDIGGGARSVQIAAALRVVASDQRVKSLLINVFGGITRGDEIAAGLLEALAAIPRMRQVPIVVRLEGNSAVEGRELLRAATLPNLHVIDTAPAAIQLAVELAKQAPTVQPLRVVRDLCADPMEPEPPRTDAIDLDSLMPAVRDPEE